MKIKTNRILFYLLGMSILALGLTLSTKANPGVGTVLAMFGTGRVIALFNKFFGARLRKAAASPDSGASERKVTA